MKSLHICLITVSVAWAIFFGFGFTCMGFTAPNEPGDTKPGWLYFLIGQAWCAPAYLIIFFAGRSLKRRERPQPQARGFAVVGFEPPPADPPLAVAVTPAGRGKGPHVLFKLLLGVAMGLCIAWIVIFTLVAVVSLADRPGRIISHPRETIGLLAVTLPAWLVLILGVRFVKRLGRVYEEPGRSFDVLPPKRD